MNKRGFSLGQSVITMVILSLVMLSSMTLTSKIKAQQSDNTERQMLSLLNVNKLEELNQELNSTGVLPLGTESLELYYGMKPCRMEVAISGNPGDDVYHIKIISRFTGIQKRSVTSEVLMALEANFEQ